LVNLNNLAQGKQDKEDALFQGIEAHRQTPKIDPARNKKTAIDNFFELGLL
jgi:hypothetical protein